MQANCSTHLPPRRPTQIKGVHHLIFRRAAAALAQVGFHQVHFIGHEPRAGVDRQGVGVIIKKPQVPSARSGASHGEVGALAVAKFGVEQRVRHECFQPGFVPANADPECAPIKAACPAQLQFKCWCPGGGGGEGVGDQGGVIRLRAVERHGDVPVVRVGPARFSAEALANRPQGGDQVLAGVLRWDDCGEQASHVPQGTLGGDV